ncbi:MAG: hotdog fold thioesterase [Methanoregulaceae archaeon]|nr:hotdog fold thioesterase [Methanoregulaceae archaeon]
MDLTDFFSRDAYARLTGIRMIDVGQGTARVSMKIREEHLNSHGTVHGGAIFTLADTAFALASNSHGIPAAAINASITYMKAAREGELFADAGEFAENPKLATYVVTVTDDSGDRIALFQGMVYRKPKRDLVN